MLNHSFVTPNRKTKRPTENVHWSREFVALSLPFIRQVFQAVHGESLIFTFVNEKIGQFTWSLAFCLVYRSQLLPLAWMRYPADPGSSKTIPQIKLLKQILPWVPKNTEVVVLGDLESYVEVLVWTRANTKWRLLLSNWQDKFIKQRRIC